MNIITTFVVALLTCSAATAVALEAEPLARVGSYWNYWVAQEYSYGYNKYKVIKDTVITAKMYDTGETLTATASWIDKSCSLTYHNQTSGTDDVYLGSFAAIRIGNASYVYDLRPKKWFKWIDMDATPGDKWIVPEIITGKGVNDYVEVSFRDTLEVDGRKIPYIYLMPSCTSRFSTSKDYTSRIAMQGFFNIDFWSLNGTPEPLPNGIVYTQELREINVGLICADVNGISLATDRLEEYVKSNNSPYYDKGIVDCAELHAPMKPDSEAPAPVNASCSPTTARGNAVSQVGAFRTGRHMPVARFATGAETDDDGSLINLPVVVHVVYNPEQPEERISKAQIDDMINALNQAYGETRPEKVRAVFRDVVGNPNINFVLADTDPQGNPTDGVVYHETTLDYYPLTGKGKEKYAYKYESDGTPRNWDHKRYTNIYVVDFGGFNGKGNVGGFVTNPEPTDNASWEHQKSWYRDADMTFWTNWLATAEASELDGLSVDNYYTFGGSGQTNPKATYATAIHELGHYLGLRHPSVQMVQNSDGSIESFDDGFSDTPPIPFNQYKQTDCANDVYQCGELVQVENFMDYCLECACMFTQQQSAFMRKFLKEARGGNIQLGVSSPVTFSERPEAFFDSQDKEIFFNGVFASANIYDIFGKLVASTEDYQIDASGYTPGIYVVVFTTDRKETYSSKIAVNL